MILETWAIYAMGSTSITEIALHNFGIKVEKSWTFYKILDLIPLI